MAQLYLDECVPLSLVPLLVTQGHDVTTAMQLGLRGRGDPFHFKYATDQKRILLTTNQSDFRLLHRFWTTMQSWEVLASPHRGILATGIRNFDEQMFAQAITDHLSQLESIVNTFWTWEPGTGWHVDKW